MAEYTLEGEKWGASSTLGTAGGQVTWSFETANYAGQPYQWDAPISNGTLQGQVRAAFAKWESVCNIDFVEVADGPDVNIRLGFDAIDGPYKILGQCTNTWNSSNILIDADIRFDIAESWGSGVSLYAAALHEIGHAIGLDHYNGAPEIMNATINVGDLKAGDIAGAQALYGVASPNNANHVVAGTEGPDSLYGLSGSDTIYGFAGDDSLWGGAGADILDGGAGTDLARYDDAAVGVYARLDLPAVSSGDAAGDSYVGIEGLVGSAYTDVLVGDEGSNPIYGLIGDDTLYGLGGYDYIYGNEGNDAIQGGAGGDYIDGGTGFDFARYDNAPTGVQARLDNPYLNSGEAAGDTMYNFEGLVGSQYGDILVGNNADPGNQIYGYGGPDTIYGLDGADFLSGGTGSDSFFTGAGTDTVYIPVSDLVNGDNDRIYDFTDGQDVLMFQGIAANTVSVIDTSGGTLFGIPVPGGGQQTVFLDGIDKAHSLDQVVFL